MLEKLHQHIIAELEQSARTDTIFVVTAVVFNLLVLGVNSAVASSARSQGSPTADIVLVIFIAMNVLVNTLAIGALFLGRQTRSKLLKGLLTMYLDNHVGKYYDSSLLTNYNSRYLLFTGVILCLALTATAVPLVLR